MLLRSPYCAIPIQCTLVYHLHRVLRLVRPAPFVSSDQKSFVPCFVSMETLPTIDTSLYYSRGCQTEQGLFFITCHLTTHTIVPAINGKYPGTTMQNVIRYIMRNASGNSRYHEGEIVEYLVVSRGRYTTYYGTVVRTMAGNSTQIMPARSIDIAILSNYLPFHLSNSD